MKGLFLRTAAAAVPALFCAFLAGCNEASPPSAAAADQKAGAEKTTARAVIERATGKTAVDQGRSARDQLHAIDQQRRKDMEVLEQ